MDNGGIEAANHGIERSPHWPSVEKAHKKMEPLCIHCGQGEPAVSIQVHHGFPFHYCIALGRPDLELDHRNLHSLCETTAHQESENAHLLIGHADNFQSSNLYVVQDASGLLHGMSAVQIKSQPLYQDRLKNRLKPLHEMTEEDKSALRRMMDDTYPPLSYSGHAGG